jgi:hypothetical protein
VRARRRTAHQMVPTKREAGFVAGAEGLAFGVLVFVVGTLLVLSGWSVIDAKVAVEAAAREAGRAVVESPVADLGNGQANALAHASAVQALTAHGGSPLDPDATWRITSIRVTGDRVRCGQIFAEVIVEVDTVNLPIIGGGFGTVEVVGTHTERIEPYRAGLPISPGGIRC